MARLSLAVVATLFRYYSAPSIKQQKQFRREKQGYNYIYQAKRAHRNSRLNYFPLGLTGSQLKGDNWHPPCPQLNLGFFESIMPLGLLGLPFDEASLSLHSVITACWQQRASNQTEAEAELSSNRATWEKKGAFIWHFYLFLAEMVKASAAQLSGRPSLLLFFSVSFFMSSLQVGLCCFRVSVCPPLFSLPRKSYADGRVWHQLLSLLIFLKRGSLNMKQPSTDFFLVGLGRSLGISLTWKGEMKISLICYPCEDLPKAGFFSGRCEADAVLTDNTQYSPGPGVPSFVTPEANLLTVDPKKSSFLTPCHPLLCFFFCSSQLSFVYKTSGFKPQGCTFLNLVIDCVTFFLFTLYFSCFA